MSDYIEYGGIEEDAKELRKKVADFFQTDYQVLYDALRETYDQGVEDTREQIAVEIEALEMPTKRHERNLNRYEDGFLYGKWTAGYIARGQK